MPCRPCPAGWQPVAIDAEVVRVVDGKTLRCAVNERASEAIRDKFGVRSGDRRSARRPSQMTSTARFMLLP